ncbi:intermembrane transport protein PqiB [Cobetia marina]|jgi:paraquat-inducible protein B|uniref:Intermembrane transport protein PqiB n=1 Tax=Cobetia marina TaxID=28258 RepID=A0ABU9GCV2_COBMA|nr:MULTISPECIES: intermembrane transport protein PqiB [Cobetia]AOM01939.1 mammalian cell entry protein [Cobetia marina]AZV31787.1 mammalian cell entry protein [Cobetia sp. ICG0124]MDH2290450.1 intermembrane transport protein PqiB [Cobetia sp. 10Alg 146]MDH2372377.1 intermembrane transport protein PqiB [Cobetia sp. 3AK]MDI6002012.1 intermembrane transport protein PqiB [Cobetia pacifica]
MSDDSRARRESRRRLSPIWIVPIVALLIGAWMVWHNIASRGPQITIEMETAEGIEAGKTLIKTRNVEVGKVESVRLSDNLDKTIVTARMSKDSERMLNEDTRLWVVKPRIGREGISGLNTVLSGAYIQLQPGDSREEADHFVALEQPPVTTQDAKGLRIDLTSNDGSVLSDGDPVTYEGFVVGRVESSEFRPSEKEMHYTLYIDSPYNELVTSTTRFWSTSGVSLRLDSQGLQVDVGSLESVLSGGVAFGIPEDLPRGRPVVENTSFTLYSDQEEAREGSFHQAIDYVIMVDDTVRGLSRGAPVEFRGVRLGTVVSVPYRLTHQRVRTLSSFEIPVLIRIEPERLEGQVDDEGVKQWEKRLERLFKRGLRATLKSGNLLTGALFVDLDFYDNPPPYKTDTFDDIEVMPSVSGGLAQMEAKLNALLDKLNGLDIEPVLGNLNKTLSASESLVKRLDKTAGHVDALLGSDEVQKLPSDISTSLDNLNRTLDGLTPESSAYRKLEGDLERLDRVLKKAEPLLDTLEKNPSSLIFDKPTTRDPIPRAQ